MLADAGLKPLEIIDNGINLQFRIWRPTNLGAGGMKGGMKGGMENADEKLALKGGMKTADSIVALMRAEPHITNDALAAKLGKARNAIIKQIAKLKTNGRIRRVGPDKGGHWEVVE